ncbi:MAG: hypothetical protein PHD30_04150, partial [Paludibacter sp.]|nr:hypothetical protein [Paludibacter sp.]
MNYRLLSVVVISAVMNTGFAQENVDNIRKDFQKENSFELSAIDESTQDESADFAGQNFSTLATFSNDPFLSEV